jgi:hypothetical protein
MKDVAVTEPVTDASCSTTRPFLTLKSLFATLLHFPQS